MIGVIKPVGGCSIVKSWRFCVYYQENKVLRSTKGLGFAQKSWRKSLHMVAETKIASGSIVFD